MTRRIGRDPIQHLEELLATPRLAMQRDQHRMLGPLALRAPRRREHRLVERGAQRVARGENDLVAHARRARAFSSKRRISSSDVPAKSGDVHRREAPRSWPVRRSRGVAAWTSGFSPSPSEARAASEIGSMSAAAYRSGLGPGTSGMPRRPAPGRGRMRQI